MSKSVLFNRFFVVSLWIAVQVLLYIKNGIVTNLEAEKYILRANNLIENGSYDLSYICYSTFIIFLALVFKLGIGYKGVVLFQLILNGFATIKIFQITKAISGEKIVAFFASLFFILCYQIQVWNFHLYTDSFFLSIVILFFDALINSNLTKWSNRIKFATLLLLLLFARPTGILFLVPFIVYVIIKNRNTIFKINNYKIIFYSSLLLIFIFSGSIYLNKSQLMYNGLFQAFPSNKIICGVESGLENFISLKNNPHGTFQYLSHNITLFIKVSYLKLVSFYGMVRPFFSSTHNLILMSFYPIYLLSIIGICTKFKFKEDKYFIITTLMVFSGLVIITCVNWHSRFILPILPFIIILAAIGLNRTFQLIKEKYH
jgi:hypothetical protein